MAAIRRGILLTCIAWSAIASAQGYQCDQERAQKEVQRLTEAGTILSVSQFPPNVSTVVDEHNWARAEADEKKRWAQAVDCATKKASTEMLRTLNFRAPDTSLLGTYSAGELALEPETKPARPSSAEIARKPKRERKGRSRQKAGESNVQPKPQ